MYEYETDLTYTFPSEDERGAQDTKHDADENRALARDDEDD